MNRNDFFNKCMEFGLNEDIAFKLTELTKELDMSYKLDETMGELLDDLKQSYYIFRWKKLRQIKHNK